MSDSLTRARESLLLRLRLARVCEFRNQHKERDKLLILAGVDARRLGWNLIAAYCRKKILQHNRGHMLHKYRSFAEAVQDDEFTSLQRRLEREFPSERVEQLLVEVNMPEHPREEVGDDFEYAAGLLGTSRALLESAERDPPEEEQPEPIDAPRGTRWLLVVALLIGLSLVIGWLVWWSNHRT